MFQGRYKAIIVEKDGYLLELARYVVLNPLRARMVKDVSDWPWSSFAAMTGRQVAPDWLETDWILGQFSAQRRHAIKLYVDFVRAGVGLPSIWDQLSGQVYLGSEAFINGMQHLTDKIAIGEIPRAQRRPLAKPLSHYQAKYHDPRAAMVAAYATGDYTMQAIADYFGVHYATVSRTVRKGEVA
ncbi:MAG: hypothetical protein WCB93_07840 [Gallionella sp.]